MKWILWGVIGLCFLFACEMDCRTREVYNVIWWISGTAAAGLVALSSRAGKTPLFELCLFCVIQLRVFSKMYGRADCYAFCVCAAAESSEGFGLEVFLVHMMLAIGLLAIVQLLRRNIDGRGRLKQAVPFLPYITLSFGLLFLIF